MSKIDELIAEYCPDGVEYKELEEIFTLKNGYTPSTSNSDYWANACIPWFRMEDIRINGNILSESIQKINVSAVKGGRLFPANSILIATSATIGDHALIMVPHLSNQRFTSLSLKAEFTEFLHMKFIFYYCFLLGEWCKKNTTTSSFASVDMSAFKKFSIPIPPLQVQEEIVRILDQFTALEAELEAELEARTRQYEHYRNQLLSFEGEEVEWKTLGEVGEFIRGSGLQKTDFRESGVGCIHYGQIYTYYGTSAIETKSFVSEKLAMKLRKAKKGDLVIAGVSENIEDVCKAVVWLGEEDICISGDSFAFRHNQNPKFIGYLLQTDMFLKFKKKYAQGAKVTRLRSGSLPTFTIPVPPLAEQERIVAILDKFDALVNDIAIGLPAEIQARRQQYEYYRGKLLSFEPLNT